MIFFYEFLFVLVGLLTVLLGEVWNRTAAVVFIGAWFGLVALGYASFGARLALSDQPLSDDDRRWFVDARDGLRHLRLLFGLGALATLAWRIIAG